MIVLVLDDTSSYLCLRVRRFGTRDRHNQLPQLSSIHSNVGAIERERFVISRYVGGIELINIFGLVQQVFGQLIGSFHALPVDRQVRLVCKLGGVARPRNNPIHNEQWDHRLIKV